MSGSWRTSTSESEQRKARGIAYVLIERLNNERLPMALDLKKKVDRGEPLSNFDLSFLKRVMAEAGDVRSFVATHPEYQELITRMAQLYSEIIRKGAQNAQQPVPKNDATH